MRWYWICSRVMSSHFPHAFDKSSPRIRRAHFSPISCNSRELLALALHELKHFSRPLMAMR